MPFLAGILAAARCLPSAALALLVASAAPDARAQEDATAGPVAGAAPAFADGLSADAIYERYSEQRTRESFQKVRIVSRDPGGSEQLSQFDLRVQDARAEDGSARDGVRFRTRIDVHEPFDMRHTRYLIITKEGGRDDEFVYAPSARRVRRVDLTNTSFLGTDYTFGDFTVENAPDAEHTRHPDEQIDGLPVFVIETRVDADAEGVQYPRRIAYIEKDHYLPLRIRSWNKVGVEVKEMTAPADAIRRFDDIWLATESTVRDLLQQTSSTMFVDEIDPKPEFDRGVFTQGRLARGR